MKGFRKLGTGAVCLLLACLLAVTASAAAVEDCPGGCAHQAAVGTTHYDTLGEAVAAAADGATVTLLTDMTVDTMLTIGKPLALDLGGKTVTGNLLSPSQSVIRFTAGGTLRNGTITVTNGSALQAAGCAVAVEKDVVLEGCGTAPTLLLTAADGSTASVKVSGTVSNKGNSAPIYSQYSETGSCELYILEDARITSDTCSAIELHAAGKLEAAGGTIQSKADSICVHIYEDRTTELSITGGTILSEEGQVIAITTYGDAVVPEAFVTGGTFSSLPQAYVPACGKVTQNADGTVTLISHYTVSFAANGGTGSMDAVSVNCGSAVILPECGFAAPAGKDFDCWQVGSKTYQPGGSFTPEADVTVTALWKTHTHTGGKATCEKKAVCQSCGQTYGQLGDHDLDYVGAYRATCTASGMNAHSRCSVCGGCFVDGVKISASSLTIPALGHEWENMEGVAATCESQGLRDYKQCQHCGELRVEGSSVTREELIVPATGHVIQMVPAVQATCTEAGTRAHGFCTGCGQRFLGSEAVEEDALTTALASHVLSDWQGDESYHWKSCVDCGAVFRLDGHTDADQSGHCDECEAPVEPEGEETPAARSGLGWLWLLPLAVAVIGAVLLLLKKRKTENV